MIQAYALNRIYVCVYVCVCVFASVYICVRVFGSNASAISAQVSEREAEIPEPEHAAAGTARNIAWSPCAVPVGAFWRQHLTPPRANISGGNAVKLNNQTCKVLLLLLVL